MKPDAGENYFAHCAEKEMWNSCFCTDQFLHDSLEFICFDQFDFNSQEINKNNDKIHPTSSACLYIPLESMLNPLDQDNPDSYLHLGVWKNSETIWIWILVRTGLPNLYPVSGFEIVLRFNPTAQSDLDSKVLKYQPLAFSACLFSCNLMM